MHERGRDGSPDPSAGSAATDWLRRLFLDISIRSPHGIGWGVDRADAPLLVRVAPAEEAVAEVDLRDDGPLTRIAVAEQVQRHIDTVWEVPLPPCPDHGVGLRARRVGDEVRWRCAYGDADCAVGAYDELLWPPGPQDTHLAPALLGHRLHRRGVVAVASWGVVDGIVRARVREGSDEAGLRTAAAPLPVEIEWVPPTGWARTQGPAGATLSIRHGWVRSARLAGVLRRSPSGGLQVGDTEIRLTFDHRVGPPGSPLLLDPDGVPFADDGDDVVCTGGSEPGVAVRGSSGIFAVGRLTRPTGRSVGDG